jgi:limonene-1,2-epoxide hydrolase
MSGETDLALLIRQMKPVQKEGEYVFCLYESMGEAIKLEPAGLFQEQEGITVILPKSKAYEAGLSYTPPLAWITLNVHSSLEAVGLTAAVSAALTGANISCNVVAGLHHDHLFIPVKDAERAMEVLHALTGNQAMDARQVLESFWYAMQTNDFHAAARLLHDDYVLEWPQSGERVRGRENFTALNTAYPSQGKWQFRINRIVADGDRVVTDVTVTDGSRIDRAITFSTIRDGRIWRQVEYWPEAFDVQGWRAQWVEHNPDRTSE